MKSTEPSQLPQQDAEAASARQHDQVQTHRVVCKDTQQTAQAKQQQQQQQNDIGGDVRMHRDTNVCLP